VRRSEAKSSPAAVEAAFLKRMPWAPAGATILVALVAIGALVVTSGADEATPAAREPSANAVQVERGELSAMVSLDGTLTYRARSDGSPYSAINRASGTYTELPAGGAKVDCGDEFYRVDDDPVLLLCGAVPAYRDLDEGDQGQDVRQLNRNLHQLGYDADAGVDIDPGDNDFTWETEEALERLQDDTGLKETGALDLDDAVFLPEAGRIAKVSGELGGSASPGAQVAQATSDTLEVQVDLDVSQQGAVKEGDPAQITLPGNESVKGKVDRLGTVAESGGEDEDVGAATIPAYISLDQPKQASGLDTAPVQVDITTKGVKSALSVPVTAIVGKSGGGFAVEVVRDGGPGELVGVELGLFDTANGRVEVEGDLHEGDLVVVPSL
jgi:peptidoglycan hydrolase-like protein with peptidoglycan-binding domain